MEAESEVHFTNKEKSSQGWERGGYISVLIILEIQNILQGKSIHITQIHYEKPLEKKSNTDREFTSIHLHYKCKY